MGSRCIAIGASAGGYQVLRGLVSQLPAELPAPVFIVRHVAPNGPSLLPEILSKDGPLPAVHPEDGARIQDGFIYVAPPDRHMLIDDSHIAVKIGPKENGFRPSIDALFRSAAYAFGPEAIGVVLSGALDDGASGLWSIKRLGGIAIVQDPSDAENPSMPRSALQYIEPDYEVRSSELASLLVRLVSEPADREGEPERATDDELGRMAKEIQIAAGVNLPAETVLALGELTPFTCPDCKGVLVQIKEGDRFRFRCHTGHGYTSDALLDGVMESVGSLVWQTMRGFQEASMLVEHLGRHMQEQGETAQAQVFLAKARELNRRATSFHHILMERENLNVSDVEQSESAD